MEKITKQDRRWARQKAKLRLLFTHLEDSDFSYDYGKKEVMMNNLQTKLGKSREELNVLLSEL